MIDGSVYPKDMMQMFEYLPVLRCTREHADQSVHHCFIMNALSCYYLQADAELFDLGSHAAKAHSVALELHKLHAKRCMRIRGYQSLLLYLLFMVLYLAMLYMQRNAAEGHAVSSVVRHNVMPQQGAVRTWGDVFEYLSAQAAMYWRDPTCGNGVCEAPFEFPSYARFGCAADCSFLVDAADVHPTQVLVNLAVVFPAVLLQVNRR
jgi:hypothetical protein